MLRDFIQINVQSYAKEGFLYFDLVDKLFCSQDGLLFIVLLLGKVSLKFFKHKGTKKAQSSQRKNANLIQIDISYYLIFHRTVRLQTKKLF